MERNIQLIDITPFDYLLREKQYKVVFEIMISNYRKLFNNKILIFKHLDETINKTTNEIKEENKNKDFVLYHLEIINNIIINIFNYELDEDTIIKYRILNDEDETQRNNIFKRMLKKYNILNELNKNLTDEIKTFSYYLYKHNSTDYIKITHLINKYNKHLSITLENLFESILNYNKNLNEKEKAIRKQIMSFKR